MVRNRSSRNRQTKSASRRLVERDAQASHVPMFRSTIRFKHMFRYQCTVTGNNTSLSITRANLLNLIAVGDDGGVKVHRVFSGAKLNKIEMRNPGAAAVAGSDTELTTGSVEWTSTYGPSSEISDSGTPLHPLFISTTPPRQTLSSFWSLTGFNESDVLMILNVPAMAIVDLWVEFVMQDGQTPVEFTPTASPSGGVVYAIYLDGVVSGVLKPVSYTTIL